MTYMSNAKCPPLLEEILNIIRYLPNDTTEQYKQMQDFCQDKIEEIELPTPIQEYCLRETDEFLHWSLERYEDLIKAREIFQSIALFNLQEGNKRIVSKSYLAFLRLKLFSIDKYLRRATVDLSFDENGDFTTHHSELFDVFNSISIEKASVLRIRNCPICKEVFWARRIEASPCSRKKCSSDFHKRRERIEELKERLQDALSASKKQKGMNPQNSIISDTKRKIEKLQKKITELEDKNGNL